MSRLGAARFSSSKNHRVEWFTPIMLVGGGTSVLFISHDTVQLNTMGTSYRRQMQGARVSRFKVAGIAIFSDREFTRQGLARHLPPPLLNNHKNSSLFLFAKLCHLQRPHPHSVSHTHAGQPSMLLDFLTEVLQIKLTFSTKKKALFLKILTEVLWGQTKDKAGGGGEARTPTFQIIAIFPHTVATNCCWRSERAERIGRTEKTGRTDRTWRTWIK